MKKSICSVIFGCLMVLILMHKSYSQSVTSCCSKSSTADFAMLAGDEFFKASHLAPLPFHFIPLRGTMITVKTADGTNANAFEIKSKETTKNYLLVIHEWWGLNDYIKQEAENLHEELGKVNVIAMDLYDGKVATNADEAQKLMQGANEERIRAIITAFIKYAGVDAKIQIIGWCFGGAWSLQTAMMAGKNTVGCVMYYGMPEKDKTKLSSLNAPVLGIFATKDEWINPEVVRKFDMDMKETGKSISIKSYDADHAFANPSNPKFNKDATEDAHTLAIKFLREHL